MLVLQHYLASHHLLVWKCAACPIVKLGWLEPAFEVLFDDFSAQVLVYSHIIPVTHAFAFARSLCCVQDCLLNRLKRAICRTSYTLRLVVHV